MVDPVPLALTFAQEILTEKQRTGQSHRITGAVTSKVHNPEERFYIQPLANHSVLIGSFLRQSKPIFSNGVPDTFHFSLPADKYNDFPKSEYETLSTGTDSFTPDDQLIMNESAEIDNYFVASGSNGHGIALASGVGKYTAELIYYENTNLRKQYSLKYPTYNEVLGYEWPLFFKPDETGKKAFEDLSKQGILGKAR
ncbi:unnamed protein product [Adineta steineri]|uniref:FAD dependent oxidoreductase domain-containing protein n=1 Tax=Adineta steineri TaxID=433720 RepID=A0A815H7U9_9BILA|nr:unnamed protein product [Adineta steineri]CAF1595889.1 unnamed protein product [Adineta steineri]